MSQRAMSPSDIEVLIHYHCCADEHERVEAPAVHEGIEWMLREGLIVRRKERDPRWTSSYETTVRGAVLIDAWCSQPLPVQVWVIPDRPKDATPGTV